MAESASERNQRYSRVGFGSADVLTAALVFTGVFQGLPARYWPVDVPAGVIIALFAAAGMGLLGEAPWAPRVARVASVVSLTFGLLMVITLAITASYLSGIYGPVGRGGALILVLAAALALPYLVVLPAAQLLWLGQFRAEKRGEPAAANPPPTPVASES
jgi:hypothetical protein